MNDGDDKILLADLALQLDRDAHTVRRWVRDAENVRRIAGRLPTDMGFLPEHLWPGRESGGRHRIYWTTEQVEGMRAFAAEKAGRMGWQAGTQGA